MSEPTAGEVGQVDEVDADLAAQFEAIGRRAGAELRRPPPAGSLLAAERAARRHRMTTIGVVAAVGAVLVVGVVAGGLLLGGDGEDPVPATLPPSVPTTAVARAALDLAHDGPLDGVAVTPDGSLAVTLAVSDGPTPYVLTGWDLRTGAQRFRVTQSANSGPVLGMSADGATFAVRTNPDVERFLSTLDGSAAEPTDVVWSDPWLPVAGPDGRFRVELDESSADRSVRLLGPDVPGGVEVAQLDDDPVTAAFSGDGAHVAVLDGTSVAVWRTSDPARVAGFALPADAGVLGHLAMDAAGAIVLVAAGDQLLVRPVPTPVAPVTDARDSLGAPS
jgi:hypothetical protein